MSNENYTVLIVDDSSTNRSYLHYVLDEDGYTVIEAGSGEECLVLAKKVKPMLILMDVIMDGIDGFTATELLKQMPDTASIPIIMLTSLDDEESKLQAFELGAVDYIVKSAYAAEIKARVRVHIRLSLANQELLRLRTESITQIAAAQKALLARPQDFPGANFAAYYKALHEAGGDFYDVVQIAEDVHFFLMADVAGHDIGTSYITPAVKVLLKQYATPAYQMEETLAFMSNILAQTVCQDTYMTAAVLRLNRRSLKAVYANAGHPPIIYIPQEGPCKLLESRNPPIGMMEDITYKTESIDVSPNDKFILFTDGLVELPGADDSNPVPWTDGVEGMLEYAEHVRNLPLHIIPEELHKAVAGTKSVDDDIAILVVSV